MFEGGRSHTMKKQINSLRGLDELIAEKVFDWSDFWHGPYNLMGYPPNERAMGIDAERCEVWEYSADLNTAWCLVEEMRRRGWFSQLTDLSLGKGYERYSVIFGHQSISPIVIYEASTLPIAICLAALKAEGIEVDLQVKGEGDRTTP